MTVQQYADPIARFLNYHQQELEKNHLKLPGACCLSTMGLDGYPNSRFVSLKEVKENAFIITGSLDSRKSKEAARHPKAALSFWWTATERQVRIQGEVTRISKEDADRYFLERNRESQIVAVVSKQGAELEDEASLLREYAAMELLFKGKAIERPEDWGGLAIHPVRIEFLTFQDTRFHHRVLYTRVPGGWDISHLQP